MNMVVLQVSIWSQTWRRQVDKNGYDSVVRQVMHMAMDSIPIFPFHVNFGTFNPWMFLISNVIFRRSIIIVIFSDKTEKKSHNLENTNNPTRDFVTNPKICSLTNNFILNILHVTYDILRLQAKKQAVTLCRVIKEVHGLKEAHRFWCLLKLKIKGFYD